MKRFLMVAICIAVPLRAQQVSKLSGGVEISSETFTQILQVREVAGQVLVRDRDDAIAVDLRSHQSSPISRKGSGPGEYGVASSLVAGPGDLTILADDAMRRWVWLRRASPLPTFREYATADSVAHTMSTIILGADQQGRLLVEVFDRMAFQRRLRDMQLGQVRVTDDSFALAWMTKTGRLDTIAMLRQGLMAMKTVQKAVLLHLTSLLKVDEQAVVTSEGWVAIARQSPYRIDWVAPDQRYVHGPVLATSPAPVTEQEKRFAIDQGTRATGKNKLLPEDYPYWPATLPPFDVNAVFPLPDGQVLVCRMISSKSRNRLCDVVDRSRGLVRQVALSLDRRIIGVGDHALYVILKDEDDVQHLWRYPWK